MGQLGRAQAAGPRRCGLTLRSSGLPPAGHLGRGAASVIILSAAQAPRRHQPLSSNVRAHVARTLDAGSWNLQLVNGWRSERGDTEHVLFPPDDGPVLNISCSNIDRQLTEEDLHYLNRDEIADGHTPERVRLGDFEGLAFRYIEDGVCWRHWDVVRGSLWLSIAYSYSLTGAVSHEAAVETMLGSLATSGRAL